jgi:ompA/motB domain protein
MRKQILALTALVALGANAQEYNKWSIDVNGGVNKPVREFTSGYATKTPNFFTVNGGVRYMFNNKFGLRLGGGYDKFEERDNSPKFNSNLWNVNLQAVANVGRVLSFEDWTRDLGLLVHTGVGIGQLKSDNFDKADNLGFVTFGVTPQVRLSNRVALLFDGSVYWYARQNKTFDGLSNTTHDGFKGLNFTGTIGLQVALGRHMVHADWYSEGKELERKLQAAEDRIAKAESDVANLAKKLDEKEDRMVDTNGNRIPDELENYLNEKYGSNAENKYATGDAARELIEKGYINVYFDFNSSKPQKSSLWAVDFVANYLKQNSGASVNAVGYADEKGSENYNQKLSAKRAEVIKQLLVDRGINASQLSFEGKGEDKTVNANSSNARQLARRVTFELK